MDQKQPGFPEDVLPNYLTALGVPFHIIEKDTYSVVKSIIPEGKPPAAYVRACAAVHCMVLLNPSAPLKLLWATTDDIVETLF